MNEAPNTAAKFLNGGGTGALIIIIVWVLKQWAHVDVPTEVSMAMATLIPMVVFHFSGNPKPDAKLDPDPADH